MTATKNLKPITITIHPVAQEKLIQDGCVIFPELEASKLHMDGSMIEFLEALLQQYALEKLTLIPVDDTDKAIREYRECDLVLRVQTELISYLLEVDAHNKKQQLIADNLLNNSTTRTNTL
jgi:hypothetical protein